MITQEDIDNTIKNCCLRKEVYGVDICKGECYPCNVVIEKGTCDELIALFAKEKENANTGTDSNSK